MVVMAMSIAMGAGVLSVKQAHARQLDAQLGADLSLQSNEIRAPLIRTVRRVTGVAAVSPVRNASWGAVFASRPDVSARLEAIEPHSYFRISGFAWTHGDDGRAERALARGGSVLVAESLARKVGVDVGDRVRLQTGRGIRSFVVAGRYLALLTPPAVVFGAADAGRWFTLGPPNQLLVDVAPGTDVSAMMHRITKALGKDASAVGFAPGAQMKAIVARDTARYSKVFNSILGVAVLIGLLGLANTLAMSVLERRREIGVLRAVGTHRRGVAAMVLVESATLVLVAYVLSLPLGALLASVVVGSIAAGLGYGAHFLYPWPLLLPLAFLGAVVAFAAAAVPARQAAMLDPVTALRFD
jgi:putative ABC transport system permease protein